MTELPKVDATTSAYEMARGRVERRRAFVRDVVAYVVINAFLVVIWALGDRGSFWPGWVMAGWAVFLVLDAWKAFGQKPVTETDIQREMERLR